MPGSSTTQEVMGKEGSLHTYMLNVYSTSPLVLQEWIGVNCRRALFSFLFGSATKLVKWEEMNLEGLSCLQSV